MRKKTLCLLALALFAATARADDYTLGVPQVPILHNTSNAGNNAWLSANCCYSVAAITSPVANGDTEAAISDKVAVGGAQYQLAGCEVGYAIERTKPDYYLADSITPPDNVDWDATYVEFLAHGNQENLLFDRYNCAIYATAGGNVHIDWILTDGTTKPIAYVIATATQDRPKRIYWTDYPYNAPGIDLSGKFVRFFGNRDILELKFGVSTNFVGGFEQIVTNKVTSGLYVDPATMTLFAAGKLTGQVIMAYYDSGSYDRLTSIQVVEVLEPNIITLDGVIGEPLKPSGKGYNTEGLVPQPTFVTETDNRGPYLYQHKGSYSYSPKNNNVYPLRPTMDARWNAEVYWKEADAMGVLWPFEVCQYRCDWPKNTQIFVRGDVAGEVGRPIYFSNEYSVELQKYQEPEGHARAPTSDGSFSTVLGGDVTEGYSLLKITGDDNVWFLPIHSVTRSDTNYFTLASAELEVASEARPRLGLDGGFTTNFTSVVDLQSSGYLYPPTSGTHYNPNFYRAPTALVDTNSESAEEQTGETVPSAVFPVNVAQTGNNNLEVWWNSTFQLEDMPEPVTIPCLPQTYTAAWPADENAAQIALASQKGSANDFMLQQLGSSIQASGAGAGVAIPDRIFFGEGSGTIMFWTRADAYDRGVLATFGESGSSSALSLSTSGRRIKIAAGDAIISGEFVNEDPSVWTHLALTWCPTNILLVIDGNVVASRTVGAGQLNALAGTLGGCSFGADSSRAAQVGREFCEFSTWRRTYTPEELKAERYRRLTGAESGLTSYFSLESDSDVVQSNGELFLLDRVLYQECRATGFAVMNGHGAPGYGNGVITADSTPRIYYENNRGAIGYNPNE